MTSLHEKQHVFNLDPNEKQKIFFLAREKFILYGGAKGGGKSWAIRTKQILRRFKYPRSKGLLLRRTHPELLRNHIFRIREEWPTLRFNNVNKVFSFPNGSYLELGSAQHEADILNYQGAEYEDIGLDEATSFTEYQYDILRSCLRTVRTDIKTQFYLGANPGGVGHGWVKRNLVDMVDPNKRFIPAKVYDNPKLMLADPDYVKELEKLPPQLRRAFLEGDWDIFAGQVFNEWRHEKHVVTFFDYPIELCKKVICFDWGYNAPACAIWLAFTPDGRVYAYRELYQTKKDPEEWAKDILIFTKIEPIEYMVLPHDCFSIVHGGRSIADTFMSEGIKPIIRGPTLDGRAVKNRLAITHLFLNDAPDEKPYLQIHEKCKNLIRTLPELVYSETDPEVINTEGEDHAYDALSLGLMMKVVFAMESGAVIPIRPQLQLQKRFETTPTGEIIAPDFWSAFKDQYYKAGRNWQYK